MIRFLVIAVCAALSIFTFFLASCSDADRRSAEPEWMRKLNKEIQIYQEQQAREEQARLERLKLLQQADMIDAINRHNATQQQLLLQKMLERPPSYTIRPDHMGGLRVEPD